MSQQIKKKFIEANAIDGSKLQFSNDEAFRIKKLDGSSQDVFKLDISDKLQFLVSPYVGPNSTDQLAPKSYVDQKVADLVASAPAVLDTLNELSAAIANDPNFATTVASQVATVQTNLNSEISRATGAEAGLQSQIDALEALSGSGLTQEISDRIAGDAAEAAARAAEDLTFVKLDGSRSWDGPSPLNMNGHAISGITNLTSAAVGNLEIGSVAGSIQFNSAVVSTNPVIIENDLNTPTLHTDISSASVSVIDVSGADEVSSELGAAYIQLTDNINTKAGYLDTTGLYFDTQMLLSAADGDIEMTATGGVIRMSSDIQMGAGKKITQLEAGNALDDAATYGQVLGVSNTASSIQSELDATQVGAGLGSSGSYSAPVGSSYLGSAVSLKDADSKLDTQIKVVADGLAQEILDRVSDVNAEESRAMAAESALDGRLDILEGDATVVGSVAKAEADAKAYTDSEIAALVNGAPALLDTLNELAAAINDDANFAVTVANSIAGVQSNLTQEISNRIADVNAEESRAMGVEASLQSQITQEISDRQADVNAEETRALAAESALDARLDVLEADPTTKTYVDQEVAAEESRAMAAESALDARVVALEGVAVQFASEKFTLSAGDISNGYVTLGHVAVAGSMNAFVDRLAIFQTDDYTLSTVGSAPNQVTRVTFAGSLITPGQEKLSSGDVVRVKYAYEVL